MVVPGSMLLVFLGMFPMYWKAVLQVAKLALNKWLRDAVRASDYLIEN